MEKSNQIQNNGQIENLPFTKLPKELNQYIFSFFSSPSDLAKSSLINKNFSTFNKNVLALNKDKLEQTKNTSSDTNKARKLPVSEIEEHINFLIKIGYKFEAFKTLQNIYSEEFERVVNSVFYKNEEAGNLEQLKEIEKLLLSTFKLAGYINARFISNVTNGMCGDAERPIILITLCAIKILLEDHYENLAIQKEFELVNKYLLESIGEITFYKKDNKACIGPVLVDDLLHEFDIYNQKSTAFDATKQWLSENGYIGNSNPVEMQTQKPSI